MSSTQSVTSTAARSWMCCSQARRRLGRSSATSRCLSPRSRGTYGCSVRWDSLAAELMAAAGSTAWLQSIFHPCTTGWPSTSGRSTTDWIGSRTTSKSCNDKERTVAPDRHGSAVITFPNELEVVITREFDAPIALVFDVLTKPEHVSKWGAPFACEVTECSIDLRVGGNYHIVFVTDDVTECSVRGTYPEVEYPTRTVVTWPFEGCP